MLWPMLQILLIVVPVAGQLLCHCTRGFARIAAC